MPSTALSLNKLLQGKMDSNGGRETPPGTTIHIPETEPGLTDCPALLPKTDKIDGKKCNNESHSCQLNNSLVRALSL